MKKLKDLTEKEIKVLQECARIKCVDCERPCYSSIGLSWEDWSTVANMTYELDKVVKQL